MKISILGTGDLTKIPRFTKFSKEKLKKLINNLGKLLAEKSHEIVVIPDRGVPTEVAKVYRENGGKKVYGVVPVKDKKYGTRHIQPYLKLIDERIKVDSWYDADGEIASLGKLCIIIGLSPGILREVTVLKYHYRYLNCKTKIIWFKNTITAVPKEVEEEIPITYISSLKELEKYL